MKEELFESIASCNKNTQKHMKETIDTSAILDNLENAFDDLYEATGSSMVFTIVVSDALINSRVPIKYIKELIDKLNDRTAGL